MTRCAKYQLLDWSRSGWKDWGGVLGSKWLLCLTSTKLLLSCLELSWVELRNNILPAELWFQKQGNTTVFTIFSLRTYALNSLQIKIIKNSWKISMLKTLTEYRKLNARILHKKIVEHIHEFEGTRHCNKEENKTKQEVVHRWRNSSCSCTTGIFRILSRNWRCASR